MACGHCGGRGYLWTHHVTGDRDEKVPCPWCQPEGKEKMVKVVKATSKSKSVKGDPALDVEAMKQMKAIAKFLSPKMFMNLDTNTLEQFKRKFGNINAEIDYYLGIRRKQSASGLRNK